MWNPKSTGAATRKPLFTAFALASAALAAPAPGEAAFIASLRDGLWYCTFPSSDCSFDAAVPGPADTVRIAHNVTLWGQAANPTPPLITEIASLELATTGFLGIYDTRTLRLLGNSLLEGGEVNFVVNGGGTLENRGTLTVSSLDGARIVGGVPINRSLWRIASGSRMDFNVGGAGFSNSQGPGGTAVFELQGTARLQGSFFDNIGILRKTGAGTATLIARVRSTVEGVDGGNIEVNAGELLLTSQVSPQVDGVIEAFGSRLQVAAGAALRVAAGGQYRLMGIGQTYSHGLSGGGKFVLDEGGTMITDGTSGTTALLTFDAGEFELRGGAIFGSHIRNDGVIVLAGPAGKAIHALNNANEIRVAVGQTLTINGAITNQAGATVVLEGGSVIDGGAPIVNFGTVAKRGSGTAVLGLFGYNASGSPGILVVEGGTLERRDGSGNFNGTIWTRAGTTYRRANTAGDLNFDDCVPGAILAGAGRVEASTLFLNCLIEPGDFGVGTLTVDAPVNLNNAAIMRFEIGGTAPAQMDHLVLGGLNNGNANSQLRAQFVNDFLPRRGQRFPLVQTPTAPMPFMTVVPEGLYPGFQSHLEYVGGVLELVADNDGRSADTLFYSGFED